MNSFNSLILQGGKYTIDQELGRGGFGITYRARNTTLDQVVVIKTLNDSLRQDPNFLNHQQRFQDEARRLAKCFHPNIVRVTDFFTEAGLPYIVMDYIPGQTLDTFILPNHPLPEALALQYIQQVGEAVQVIHQNGLLHRDIKPQNIILHQGTQRVVLIDFGIAREFTPGLTQTHTHMVSEGYAPIEQYLPQAKRLPTTDVYGLAATLYTLVTGQVPMAAPLRDRCPLVEPRHARPELSPQVNQAILRGMAMEPEQRPATVDQWLALLPVGLPLPAGVSAAQRPVSQMATMAVAPVYRGSVQPKPARNTPAPAKSERSRDRRPGWWLGFLAVLILSSLIGYGLWQLLSPAPDSTEEEEPEIVPSPSPRNRPEQRPNRPRSETPAPEEAIEPVSPESTPAEESPLPPEAEQSPVVEPSPSPVPTESPALELPPEPEPPPIDVPAPTPETDSGTSEESVIQQEPPAAVESTPPDQLQDNDKIKF